MNTTIRLPAESLAGVDWQARDRDISRKRDLTRTPERAIATETEWSAGFVDGLAAARADVDGCRALEEVRACVASSRTRKEPPSFA